MARVRLETERISDGATFHRAFKRLLGFPDFYGANMDAWIDCMSSLRDQEAGMSSVLLGGDEALELQILNAEDFRIRLPEIANALWDCTGFVNRRYTDAGEHPAVLLVPIDGRPSPSTTERRVTDDTDRLPR